MDSLEFRAYQRLQEPKNGLGHSVILDTLSEKLEILRKFYPCLINRRVAQKSHRLNLVSLESSLN